MRNLMLLATLVLFVTLLCCYVISMRGPALIDNPYVDGDAQSSKGNF